MASNYPAEHGSTEADSAEEESGSGSESEESEEEVEPQLRYDRVTGDLNSLLSKDLASCMAVHSKFLALGTHWGSIHILDYLGYNIQGKDYQAHTTAVNQISVDDNGDYIASCSDDGKVTIIGLYSGEHTQHSFDRPVKSVALDPNYYRSSSRQFVTGDDKLILNERGFFKNYKPTVLHQGEGTVREIKWKGDLIAWANDFGVKVYDTGSKNRITSITKDHNYRPEAYQCNLYWKDEQMLLIGWADTVKVCVVKNRITQDVRDLPPKYVEIIAMFKTPEFFIAGISSLGDNVVVLTYAKESKDGEQQLGKQLASRPNLQILEPHMNFYDEVSNDALSIRGYINYRCGDYHLESVREDNLFYIISPKDVVVARPRDKDDHIAWLLEHEKFKEALDATMQYGKELKKHTFQDVGRQTLNFMLEEKKFTEAALLCVKIFGTKKDLWEAEAYKFARLGELRSLAPYLPRENPALSPAIYEMVLNEFLLTDDAMFLQHIKDWPYSIYSIQTIIKAVIDRLESNRNSRNLLQALALLHSYEKAFDKALAIFLKLRHKDVFELIHKHNLFDSISDKIIDLMEFDADQAVNMLLENLDKIPEDKVVGQLQTKRHLLYVYLDKLASRDSQRIRAYADKMVELYAEFDRPKLLPFLKASSDYPVDLARQIVETREFVPEQVFLLGRMGNLKPALRLITDKLQDVDQAIEFCKEHNDQELWKDLIEHSLDKPVFITGLLNSIGTHVDPILLIQRIQTGMKIPGLRDSLVKILHDYNLQISLQEGCKKILVADSFNLMDRQVRTQRRAISIDTSHMCQICQERILVNDLRYASDIVVFFCNHVVHSLCLSTGQDSCPVCSTQRRGPGSRALFGNFSLTNIISLFRIRLTYYTLFLGGLLNSPD